MHRENPHFPILTTEFGISIFFNSLQLLKAESPISITEFGILIFVKLIQLSNAKSPISVTEFGISILFNKYRC